MCSSSLHLLCTMYLTSNTLRSWLINVLEETLRKLLFLKFFISTFFSEDSILQSAVWFSFSLSSLLAWSHCKLEYLLFSQPQWKLMGLIVIASLRVWPYLLQFDASCVSCHSGFQGNDLRKILLIRADLLVWCFSILNDDITTYLARQESEGMQRRH